VIKPIDSSLSQFNEFGHSKIKSEKVPKMGTKKPPIEIGSFEV
jgi:hypothetical protein